MPNLKLRPDAPIVHHQPEEHRRLIAQRANAGLPMDGSNPMQAPLVLSHYLTAGVPDPVLWEGAYIYISDQKTPAYSDGENWVNMNYLAENNLDNKERAAQLAALIEQLRIMNLHFEVVTNEHFKEEDIEE